MAGLGHRFLLLVLLACACSALLVDHSTVDPALLGDYRLQSRLIRSDRGLQSLAPPQLSGRLHIFEDSFHFQSLFNGLLRSYGGPATAVGGYFYIQFAGRVAGEYSLKEGTLVLNYQQVTPRWGVEVKREYWSRDGEMKNDGQG